MRSKPYTAKTLSGAQDHARRLAKRYERTSALLDEYAKRLGKAETERNILAMLAAKGPTFDNPILAAEAVKIRDRVLRDHCGLNPDGSFIASSMPDPVTDAPPAPPAAGPARNMADAMVAQIAAEARAGKPTPPIDVAYLLARIAGLLTALSAERAKSAAAEERARAAEGEAERRGRELAGIRIVLDAWHEMFGTTQLTHAVERLRHAERTVERLAPATPAGEGRTECR